MTESSEFIAGDCLSSSAKTSSLAAAVFQQFYKAVMEDLQTYNPPSKRHEVLSKAYTNMLSRLHEQVSGMLVCLATKNEPSAETLARTVLETSVNLSFMLQGDRERAFFGYCEEWFSSHERQLNKWLEYETELKEKAGNIPKIQSRKELLEGQRLIIDHLVSSLGMNRAKNFRDAYPKSLFERFKRIGEEGQYFTSYHRLSNSSHVMAGDTISWLVVSMFGDHKAFVAWSAESVAYSQMMCLIALVKAVEAIGIFAIAHNCIGSSELVENCRGVLIAEIEELSNSAGVPQNQL